MMPALTSRTQLTALDNDWLVNDVVSGWDEIFGDNSTTAARPGDSANWFSTCVVGDRTTHFLWRGCQRLALHSLAATATLNWDVVMSDALSGATTRLVPTGTPESATADAVTAVEWVTEALGVTERDVLIAAGIRDRTYYHWKQNPGTSPRRASQANLWSVVGSVAAIVTELNNLAPHWLRSDPDRLELFRRGQHARLALLAAAANANVRIPSDTLDAGGIETSNEAERLKRFRTRHPVEYTHDEDGTPLTQATRLDATFYADEPEDDLVLSDADDD